MRTRQEIEERIAQHERNLDAWREDGRAGLTSLLLTEPDPYERKLVRRELKAAIIVLKWVLEDGMTREEVGAST